MRRLVGIFFVLLACSAYAKAQQYWDEFPAYWTEFNGGPTVAVGTISSINFVATSPLHCYASPALPLTTDGAFFCDFVSMLNHGLLLGQGSGLDAAVVALPDCPDSGGNHLNYVAATHSFPCGTTAPALTLNRLVLGGGAGAALKDAAGFTTDGTSKVTLGVAGTSVGSIDFKNATSGTITLQPVTGALGTVTLSLPAATATVATVPTGGDPAVGYSLVRNTTAINVTTTSETDLLNFSIPGNTLGTNRAVHFLIVGTLLLNDATAQQRYRVYYGATTMFDLTAPTTTAQNVTMPFRIEGDLIALGATNSQWVDFMIAYSARGGTNPATGLGGTGTVLLEHDYAGIAASEDSTAAKTLRISLALSAVGGSPATNAVIKYSAAWVK